ncbi:Tom37 C-terminal domain-containing protein [Pilobolus umbonatus]|nr:Tom37 C-terminal domain-containing protein [Pilobolus umbonatus]
MTAMQLYVWGPILNVASIDPKCVVIESYLRLIKQEYDIVYCNDPQMSPTGELPLLKDKQVWVAGVDRILNHLMKRGKDANEGLSEEQRAEYVAYSSLAQEKLYDCMLYSWYADSTNFIQCIRPTYADLLSFPSRYIVPIQLKKTAKARLSKYNVEITADDVGLPNNEKEELKDLMKSGWHQMYSIARDTYGILNTQLSDRDYMFGDRPSTLDCVVYGYLALHVYPNLPHGRLQHIITTEYPKLTEYCNRMKDLLFKEENNPKEAEASDDVPSVWRTFKNNPVVFVHTVKDDFMSYMGKKNDKPEKSQEQIEFDRKRIWSIAGAVTFFLGYVIYNGILSISIIDDEEEGEFYEDNDNVYEDDE